MRGTGFLKAQQDVVDRIRRATQGRADVLLMSTCPTFEHPDTLGEMAEACRGAAAAQKAGIVDIYPAFRTLPPEDREKLYASDKVHLSPLGQKLIAETMLKALLQ